MWAAFTSDLKEFASGAAEETTAAASKVGVTIGGDGDTSSDNNGGAGLLYNSTPSTNNGSSAGQQLRGGTADGSVLLANAALSMGEKGLKGLSSVGSMMGGIVAPRNTNAAGAMPNGSSGAASSLASNKPSAALNSMMLAAEDDDEEEVELGWDDDDDDIDVESLDGDSGDKGGGIMTNAAATADGDDFFKEHLGDGASPSPPPSSSSASAKTATSVTEDEQVLQALQSKLDSVEKARARLQIEHRNQTAELVELRAKVEELEQSPMPLAEGGSTSGRDRDEGVAALQEEIGQLKAQLLIEDGQSKDDDINEVIAALVQEKKDLEQELSSQEERNEQLLLERNQTANAADDSNESSSEEQELLLQKYQEQIRDLTRELETLKSALNDTSMELTQAKEHSTYQDANHQEAMQKHQFQTAQTTRDLEQSMSQMEESRTVAVKVAEEAKAKLVGMENEVKFAKKDMEDQAAQFEDRLQVEIERVKATVVDINGRGTDKVAQNDTSFKTLSINDVLQEDAKTSSNSVSQGVVQEEKEPSNSTSSPIKKLDVKEEDEEELSDDWGDGDSGEW